MFNSGAASLAWKVRASSSEPHSKPQQVRGANAHGCLEVGLGLEVLRISLAFARGRSQEKAVLCGRPLPPRLDFQAPIIGARAPAGFWWALAMGTCNFVYGT